MDEAEAITMLKELAINNLVEPSVMEILERSANNFQINIKCDYNKIE